MYNLQQYNANGLLPVFTAQYNFLRSYKGTTGHIKVATVDRLLFLE